MMENSSPINFEEVRASVKEMLENGLAGSADKFCNLILSRAGELSRDDTSALLELHGDCIFANKEYRRALELYRQASQRSLHLSSIKTDQKLSPAVKILNPRQANLRFKECDCHIHLDDHTIALRELEAIPMELRDIKINFCLGKLYKSAGLRRHAVTTLKLVVEACPTAVECIEMLADLGVKEMDIPDASGNIVDFLPQLRKGICNNSLDANVAIADVENFVRAFPDSSYALNLYAIKLHEAGRVEESLSVFQNIRRIDRYHSEGMEMYCRELFAKGDFLELSKLATDMLNINKQDCTPEKQEQSAVGWIAAGMYTQLKGDDKGEQAMGFLDKACKVNTRSTAAFNAKGNLFMQKNKPEQASIAFSQANNIKKNIDSFAGLVDVNLRLGKFNEALAAAKGAVKVNPNSSRCFSLLGKVIMKSDSANARKEAKLVLRKALKLNPKNTAAAAALSDVLCKENALDEACTCLSEALEANPRYELRCRYGKVLGILGRHDEAIQQLHTAMSTAPSSDLSEAISELEVIERSIRGCTDQDEEEDELEMSGQMMEVHGYNDWGDTQQYQHPDTPPMMEYMPPYVPDS